jgi:hypothetical protein
VAGHRRQPPDRRRPRRRARRRPVPSAWRLRALLWQEGLGWPGSGAPRSGWSWSPGGDRGRPCCWRRPGRVPPLPEPHGRRQPLPQPCAARSGRLRRVGPGAAGPLDAADRDPRRDAGAARRLAQPPDRRVLQGGGHRTIAQALDRGPRAARLDDPGAALLGGADPVARKPRRGPHRDHGRPKPGLDQVRPQAAPAALPRSRLPHPLPRRWRPRRRQNLREPARFRRMGPTRPERGSSR